jgi:hypothetical protein
MGESRPNSFGGLDYCFMPSQHDGAAALGFDVMELELQGPTNAVSSDKDGIRDYELGLDDGGARNAVPTPKDGIRDSHPSLDGGAAHDAIPIQEELEAMMCVPM